MSRGQGLGPVTAPHSGPRKAGEKRGNMSIEEKLEKFRAALEEATKEGFKSNGYSLDNPGHAASVLCRVVMGKKYAKVDTGSSGRYMVEIETGNIYGIKGYGVVHRGRAYGNLDTVTGFRWAGVHAVPVNE